MLGKLSHPMSSISPSLITLLTFKGMSSLHAFVGIHKVHWGNKWMGSSDLDELNKTTSQTAGRGLKTKQDDNKQVAKQNK